MKKKFLSMVMAVAMISTLVAGCGSNASTEGESAVTATEATVEAASASETKEEESSVVNNQTGDEENSSEEDDE